MPNKFERTKLSKEKSKCGGGRTNSASREFDAKSVCLINLQYQDWCTCKSYPVRNE